MATTSRAEEDRAEPLLVKLGASRSCGVLPRLHAARCRTKGGLPVKFARTCAQLGAVLSVGITLALACDHWAALLDKALMI